MALSVGSRLGVYEIVGPLGAGGMGVVYRARDTRLRREVALKLLPAEPGDDQHAHARLLHEARAAAALNHPNICTVYEVSEIDGTPFIAMELVAGESLQSIVARGAMTPDRVCRLGRQLAEALEHAHASGVLHRDLKSANVMVTPGGRAKVLDFGIAAHTPQWSEATETETLVEVVPRVAGTLPYMAPEVLQGGTSDVRSDVWALGVVLHEMASGDLPFRASTTSALIAAILRDPPRPLGGDVPASLGRIVRRCLVKEPAERIARASEVAVALEVTEAGFDLEGAPSIRSETPGRDDSQPGVVTTTTVRVRSLAKGVGIALLCAAGVAVWAVMYDGAARPAVPAPQRPVQLTHFSTSVRDPAISPDGRLLAFIVQEPHSTTTQIFLKPLPDGRPSQLTRGPGAKSWPAFSPDGTRIAYTVTGEEWLWDTWIVDVTGGTPQLMLRNANSLRWLKDGRVLFSEFKTGSQLGIAIADEGRGSERDLYVPPLQGMAHYSDVSPDGGQVLIGEMLGLQTRCFVMSLSGGPQRTVGSGSAPCIQLARWSPDGRFVYFVSGTQGKYQVWREPGIGGHPEAVTVGPSLALRGVIPGGFTFAPDGSTLVYAVGDTQESLWLRRPDGTERQLTFEGDARTPSVADDGQQVFYIAGPRFRPGPIRLRRLDADEDRPLATGREALAVWAVPDGRRFIFTSREPDGRVHLWLGNTDNSATPRRLSEGDGSETAAVFGRGATTVYYAQTLGQETALWSLDLTNGSREQISAPGPQLVPVSLSSDGQWLSVLRTDLTPRETWLYPTKPGVPPRRLYKSWRLEWSPGNRSFLVSNSGMISTAWSIPNPRGDVLPPPFDGEPTPLKLEKIGARKVLVADFFVDPTPLPEPFGIIYSHVEGRSNLFQIAIPSSRDPN